MVTRPRRACRPRSAAICSTTGRLSGDSRGRRAAAIAGRGSRARHRDAGRPSRRPADLEDRCRSSQCSR